MQLVDIPTTSPSILGDTEYYELQDSDLLVQFPVETGYLLEGEIDVPRLTEALSLTFTTYPLCRGVLEQPLKTAGSANWRIRLNAHPVQLEVIDEPDCQKLPKDSVIQSPWTFASPIDVQKIRKGESTPLFTIRLTRFTSLGWSVIATSTSHVIGDGSNAIKFWRLLSQHYQGLPPLDPPPTIDRRTQHPRSCLEGRDVSEIQRTQFPQLLDGDPVPIPTETSLVTLYFSDVQLRQAKEAIEPLVDSRISTQDCLTALISVAISRTLLTLKSPEPPITWINNVFNLRGEGVILKDEGPNTLSWANAFIKDPYSITDVVISLRESFVKAREPGFQRACHLVMSDLWREAADRHQAINLAPGPSQMCINSTLKFDYTSAHFGFPGKTHFLHTVSRAPRFVKMMPRNPSIGGPEKRTRWAEVVFHLEKAQMGPFVDHLSAEAMKLGIEDGIEIAVGEASHRASG